MSRQLVIVLAGGSPVPGSELAAATGNFAWAGDDRYDIRVPTADGGCP